MDVAPPGSVPPRFPWPVLEQLKAEARALRSGGAGARQRHQQMFL